MINEELEQRGLIKNGKLTGTKFGIFEEVNVGGSSIAHLIQAGLEDRLAANVDFPFTKYKVPKNTKAAKPDLLYVLKKGGKIEPIAVKEAKAASKRTSKGDVLKAAEQALFSASAVGGRFAIIGEGDRFKYIDVSASLKAKSLVYLPESRDWTPAVLENLLSGDIGVAKDPKPLAEKVWQIIWHSTKSEPKECLLTFVEIFVLKFLSDNLPATVLPNALSFYELAVDSTSFRDRYGISQIEYYVDQIRPKIKSIFPDNVIADEAGLGELFGLSTIVSKTSVINGFAFLKSSTDPLANFNRTFVEILDEFTLFGSLTTIDSEFKLRLYETFLKRSARQQKLGQFFTPRNVVRPMIKMARLNLLPEGAVVLDPAAGVGGFILEPMLYDDALPNNLIFANGKPKRRIKTVGLDVDDNLHILGKANMLIHLAEALREPKTTTAALNKAMAQTFLLMKENQTLGALEHPPRDAIDVILTNPPYVTNGSGIYKREIENLKDGTIRNGVDLKTYYDGCGLGLEAFFLRYISGALKPGGRAFVIVPLGLLNRTEPKPKRKLLDECNILASIQLPRNTFFNTAQKTFILAVEKRHTAADDRPSVMCAIARTIGETLDYRRDPTPEKNDLDAIASVFVQWTSEIDLKKVKDIEARAIATGLVKFQSADQFSDTERWDVTRFWDDQELVALGERDVAISKDEFIAETETRLEKLVLELAAVRKQIASLKAAPSKSFSLSDSDVFAVFSGDRITTEHIKANPGEVPVYSCFKEASIIKGLISEDWLLKQEFALMEQPFVTVNANGASVGKVFYRDKRCALTDDVIAVIPKNKDINLNYLAYRLRESVGKGGFLYEAKLFIKRLKKELSVDLPINQDGSLDVNNQKLQAAAEKKFEQITQEITELGKWCSSARIY